MICQDGQSDVAAPPNLKIRWAPPYRSFRSTFKVEWSILGNILLSRVDYSTFNVDPRLTRNSNAKRKTGLMPFCIFIKTFYKNGTWPNVLR